MRAATVRLLAIFFLLAEGASAADDSAVVERFVDAFNAHDVDAMLELAADDIRWMSVTGQESSLEAAGLDQLRSAMESYFSSTPSARAELRSVHVSGPFIHTVEEAFWISRDTEQSQCSMAIYELADGRIRNVWYFPAYECP